MSLSSSPTSINQTQDIGNSLRVDNTAISNPQDVAKIFAENLAQNLLTEILTCMKISTLNDLAKGSMVYKRFKQLSLRYIQNALINKNPNILGSFDEYLRFADARNLPLKKLFYDFKDKFFSSIQKNQLQAS
ncbi:hypothetical protein BpHYR1_003379 [Brachionus plicatilis]|uniref:Uncharacterized protein n=1 Tax=Brachionus plicatilis TaxID=10195 RepID=A0A3M7SYJ3_BRAPC|nr:hypothetical protein BpHYR1_003379 [Brachionus plicatilis]